jgi:hypothetical protein
MFKTKNDLSEEIRAKAVELFNARLADLRPATPGGPSLLPGGAAVPRPRAILLGPVRRTRYGPPSP